MATFLEMVQDLHFESGAAGLQPIDTTGQTGEADRLVRWVQKADFYWQSRWSNWTFMHTSLSPGFRTIQGLDTNPPDDLQSWDFETFFIRENADEGWVPMTVNEYDQVRTRPPETETGLPLEVWIMPDKTLRFLPMPDAAYEFRADYYRRPARLENSGDISRIPDEFIPTVVLGTALGYAADYEDAPELKRKALELVQDHATQFQSAYLPGQSAEWRTGADLTVVPG